MFVFASGATTPSLDFKTHQLDADTSSNGYVAPFGLWERGNAGNDNYEVFEKIGVWCPAGRIWRRLEPERIGIEFRTCLKKFELHLTAPWALRAASEGVKSLELIFLHVPENSALCHANPPPRTSAGMWIDGMSV
ncbi:hypothetical protein R3P38DRAFT_3270729 [Favolaschia claudopus]|uniref:Uncharacterized protein n=1 Tax=Favolaschia claudopus TaxID=2862362 RepID=A0AAW0BAP5_9AGAR